MLIELSISKYLIREKYVLLSYVQKGRTQNKKKYIGHYIIGKILITKIHTESFLSIYLGDTLGEGTFGKVKLATHILTGEKVAIKILEKEKIVDVSDVERVSREIHILKLLRHSNIVQLYEVAIYIGRVR